jgi:hypothetical protein
MLGEGTALAPASRAFLLRLQRRALRYFLDNQVATGLVLDRQYNRARLRRTGWCSTSATGMGYIALALAAAAPYRLLTPREAGRRIRAGVETALDQLPSDHGILPHFLHSHTGRVYAFDWFSTVDSSWLVAGALWAGAFLRDRKLEALVGRLYDRIDWLHWTGPETPAAPPLLRHGKGHDGRFLAHSWDRINGETVFMYVLGAGAARRRALPPESWHALRPFYGTVAGLRFNNADLGLFAFEYGIDLLGLHWWRPPGEVDLLAEACLGTRANQLFCQEKAATFATYRLFWGLSDGDGPGDPPATDTYRVYGPGARVDGTAHLIATLAAVAYHPDGVLENLHRAEHYQDLPVRGRYGYSNVNVDRRWVARDMIGIDAGATVLAVDNYLTAGRVRAVFQALPCVRRAMGRLKFTHLPAPGFADPDHPPTVGREG